MSAPAWKVELLTLLTLLYRYPETGLQHDIDGMDEADQYAAPAWLRRYAEGRQ